MSREEQFVAVGESACKKAREAEEDNNTCRQAAETAVKHEMNTWIDIGGPNPVTHTKKQAEAAKEPIPKPVVRTGVMDAEWRKKGPIIMVDGKVVSNYGVSTDKFGEIVEQYEKKMKTFAKIVEGLFTGHCSNDPDYRRFCDEAIDNHLKGQGKQFIEEASRTITKHIEAKKVKAVHNLCPTAPDTPVRLSPHGNTFTQSMQADALANTVRRLSQEDGLSDALEVAGEIDITDEINKEAKGHHNALRKKTTLERINAMARGDNKIGRGSAGPERRKSKRVHKKTTKKTTKKVSNKNGRAR